MAGLPPIVIRQPRPYDLVDDPIKVSGVGTAFEAVAAARVRDGNGVELIQTAITLGGTGTWANFYFELGLGGLPATPQGMLEVFEFSQSGDGSELNKIVVPITFGRVLIDPFHGFSQYQVSPGDTLSAIAQQWYGNSAKWSIIFEANRHQISNPNLIFPGQTLRIPQ